MFLDLNGVDPTTATNDGVVDLVTQVASERVELDEDALMLRALIERTKS